jgi:hypothetical protein
MARNRTSRGQLDGIAEMDLWLGPSPYLAPVFDSDEQRRELWFRHRDQMMEQHGSRGRRPVAWWRYEACELRWPGYDRERSTLYEAGLLGEAERAELLSIGASSSTAPTVPGSSTAAVRDRSSRARPPAARITAGPTFRPRWSRRGARSARAMPETSATVPAKPLALSDAQLDIVFRLAAPLLDVDRSAFLEDVARALGELPEVGDGIVARVCAQMQRKYWRPPEIGCGGAGSGKYR